MQGNSRQTLYLQKGYGPAFSREKVTVDFLKGAENVLYSSAEERHFFTYAVFNWLIRRYAFKEAFSLLLWLKSPKQQPGGFAPAAYWALLGLILFDLLLFGWFCKDSPALAKEYFAVSCYGSLLLAGFLYWLAGGIQDFFVVFRLLAPRLATTILTGYLFVLNTGRVSDVIELYRWTAAVPSLIAAIFYMRIEMAKQLTPPPAEKELWTRIGILLFISCAWSFLFTASAAVFSGNPKHISYALPSLLLGVILESVWQDKPLTEPV
ncbi:hypothetical protein [Candidatus Electronema sp. TJ]|uniref:hypothetical protein n=1 Tax=Candidatus Electronema sp. TJ TaxID=3401573 RepID=UPI003AA9E135